MSFKNEIPNPGANPEQPPVIGEASKKRIMDEQKAKLVASLVERIKRQMKEKYPSLPLADVMKKVSDDLARQKPYIEEFAEQMAEAEMRGQVDARTGLFNEHAFNRFYDSEIRHIDTGKVSAFIAFDLDYFKALNDRYGHQKGDEFLVEVGKIIQQQIRPFDIASRKGGDEFYLLLKNVTPDDVMSCMSRIAGHINGVSIAAEMTSPTISAGCVIIRPDDIPSFSEAVAKADEALYVSKMDRGRFTMMDGDQYAKYMLGIVNSEDAGPALYVPEQSGTIKELQTSPEKCLFEVMNSIQRSVEEIQNSFRDELDQRLTQEGAGDIFDLSIKKLAQLLYEARTRANGSMKESV